MNELLTNLRIETSESEILKNFGRRCIQRLRFGDCNDKIIITLNIYGQRSYRAKQLSSSVQPVIVKHLFIFKSIKKTFQLRNFKKKVIFFLIVPHKPCVCNCKHWFIFKSIKNIFNPVMSKKKQLFFDSTTPNSPTDWCS